MSKFFKALEQAEQEHALRKRAERQEAKPAEVVPPAPAAVRELPPPAWMQGVAEGASTPLVVDRPVGEGMGHRAPEAAAEASGEAPDGVEEHLVSLLAPTSFAAEQYRALRHVVEQLNKKADLSIVAVSSPAIGDGKTITAINLAGALAQASEARVLLVDADLRRSSVSHCLGLGYSGERGLVDAILEPGLALKDVVRCCPPFNLSVLPAGRRTSAPYEVLKSPRLGGLLGEARSLYDYIILDTPPLIAVPDCRVIGKWVDRFLVIVATHKTPRKLVEEALGVMDQTKIVGLVFNGDDRPLSGYYVGYGRSPDGHRARWWAQALKKLGGSVRRRRFSPSRELGRGVARR